MSYVSTVKVHADPDFGYSWTPTSTTLFRFSALTFNAHLIHLDKHYAQVVEGYPGMAVEFRRISFD